MTQIKETIIIKKTSPNGEITTTEITKTTEYIDFGDSPIRYHKHRASAQDKISMLNYLKNIKNEIILRNKKIGAEEYSFKYKNKKYTCKVKEGTITIFDENGDVYSMLNYSDPEIGSN